MKEEYKNKVSVISFFDLRPGARFRMPGFKTVYMKVAARPGATQFVSMNGILYQHLDIVFVVPEAN